jgi:thiazolinyl reductase component of yersiniabactin synthetase
LSPHRGACCKLAMKPLRVLVCGTNYGSSYLQAIRLEPRAYKLAGILTRGSDRSRSIARANGVPLWRSTDGLSADIDLACVALPSAASRVTLDLLDRGIPVLCEHPQTARLIESALKKATAHHTCFHLNAHFANLSAPQAFLRECQRHRRRHEPAFVEVVAADRALYAAVDLLRRSLGSLPHFRGRAAQHADPFSTLTGRENQLQYGLRRSGCRHQRSPRRHLAGELYGL